MKLICLFITIATLIATSTSYYHILSAKKLVPPAHLKNTSLFGYGLSYQSASKRIIVSAPKADNVGKIYQCTLPAGNCSQIKINVQENRKDDSGDIYDHDFLLGVSISSNDKVSVMCAPRNTGIKNNTFGTFGKCYYLSWESDTAVLMNSPKLRDIEVFNRSHEDSSRDNIMDGYGWSVFVTKNGEVLVGSPAMRHGTTLLYNNVTFTPTVINKFRLTNTSLYTHSLGYSTIAFKNEERETMFVVSTPYGTMGNGKVIIFTKLFKKQYNVDVVLYDDKIGALFGASLCVADLNGDGQSELLVGSPLYENKNSGQSNGAVYIYYNVLNTDKRTKKIVVGPYTDGHFGATILNIGDIDSDTHEDIAVGAPYENDGRGAVYLYSGKNIHNNANIKWIQRLQPEKVQGFGISMTSLQDYDANGCNELAIGAADSNDVILYRCFTPVTVNIIPTYPAIQKIPINMNSFLLIVTINVKYPDIVEEVMAKLKVEVKLNHKHARISSTLGSSFLYQQTLNATQTYYSQEIKVEIPKDGDYSEDIQYIIKVELSENPMTSPDFDSRRVLLRPDSINIKQGYISAKRCTTALADTHGKFRKCVPTLNLTLKVKDSYVIGNSSEEHITILVTNEGDTAYASCVQIRVSGVSFLTHPSECERLSSDIIKCSPRSPFGSFSSWNLQGITLDMKTLTSAVKHIDITTDLYDYCNNNEKVKQNKTIILITDSSSIRITRQTSENEDIIKFTEYQIKEEQRSRHVEQMYMIKYSGPTVWEGLEAKIQLKQERFINKTTIKVANEICALPSSEIGEMLNVTCSLPTFDKNSNIKIVIRMEILTQYLVGVLIANKNVTVTSTLGVEFPEDIKVQSFSNILVLIPNAKVPIWIILLSALFGIVLLIVFIFILREIGFFRRKNKSKLNSLQKSIRRQTMRSSMSVEMRKSAERRTSAVDEPRPSVERTKPTETETTESILPDEHNNTLNCTFIAELQHKLKVN